MCFSLPDGGGEDTVPESEGEGGGYLCVWGICELSGKSAEQKSLVFVEVFEGTKNITNRSNSCPVTKGSAQ